MWSNIGEPLANKLCACSNSHQRGTPRSSRVAVPRQSAFPQVSAFLSNRSCRFRTFSTFSARGQAVSLANPPELDRYNPSDEPPPLNQAQVPLISPNLRSQLFPPQESPFCPPPPDPRAVDVSLKHLRSHGLASPESTSKQASQPAVDFHLPELQGPTLAHHFHALGRYSAEPYLSIARHFATADLPPMPEKDRWICMSGWTRYSADGCWESVEHPSPDVDAMVFDVETLPFQGGNFPIMAVAVAKDGWYAWCSPWLTGEDQSPNHLIPFASKHFSGATSELLGQPDDKPRLIIGHNVLYDRARMSSEYSLRRPSTRFIDTLSLHVAVSGLTNPQRPAWLQYRKKLSTSESTGGDEIGAHDAKNAVKSKGRTGATAQKTWHEVGAVNSLAEVARLHCGIDVDKAQRNILIDPSTTIEDIRNDFEETMSYCATDVFTTLQVYQAVLPKFITSCPHPASFGGIMLMSQPFLPVDRHWPQYLERAETTYQARLEEVKVALKGLAEDARSKFEQMGDDGRFAWENDLWLRQLDWSPKRARRIAGRAPSKANAVTATNTDSPTVPAWYAELAGDVDTISLDAPSAALLLRLTWRGHPVVFSHTHGWLFIVQAERGAFESGDKEVLVDRDELEAKDEALRALSGVLYTVPSTGSGRCLKILGRGSGKRIADGLLVSKFEEFRSALCTGAKAADKERLQAKIAELARGARDIPKDAWQDDTWLSQLDWTPRADPSKAKFTRRSRSKEEPTAVDPSDLSWPRWYWDLDIPGGGLDITVRKRAVPLLLRLRWRGFPVVYSKEHGWIYRVPAKEVGALLEGDTALRPLDFADVADTDLLDDTQQATFFKLPHPDGEGKNVGNPLSKPFVAAFEDGILTSEFPAAKAALAMNASCSYWLSSRERITNQMVIWGGEAKEPAPTMIDEKTQGLILPQVIPMGTVTRRAVEKTWLTASNAKKNRVGSELKSMVRAPPGYAIVGADVDSEELWICSVMGDAQFGMHGATAIGWMTLEGTKAAGTDLHSKSASILGISRDAAKVFNYSRIYGAGIKHAVQLLIKFNPNLSLDHATTLAKDLYSATKGVVDRSPAFNRNFWHGGTESFVFNKLEEIAQSDRPRTPALGCGLTAALTKSYLPAEGRSRAGEGFMPSRINWVVQSSGVDYLHLLLVSMEYLAKRFDIDARYMISVHDEIRYLVKEEDKYRAAMALQVANIWTRSLFAYRLQMPDLPQGCAFFSAVDVDHCFRKEVNMTCETPSNPDPIAFGESLDIQACLEKTAHGSLFADGRSMSHERELPPTTASNVGDEARELSDHEIKGDQHRVTRTAFLVAQTCSSASEIKRVWNDELSAQRRGPAGRGAHRSSSRSRAGARMTTDKGVEEREVDRGAAAYHAEMFSTYLDNPLPRPPLASETRRRIKSRSPASSTAAAKTSSTTREKDGVDEGDVFVPDELEEQEYSVYEPLRRSAI